jgi:AcrR family transcriptional regulator
MPQAARSTDPFRRRREAGAAAREETRRRLVAAADALFREQGYATTTVTAIAERAGVSLQTLYLAGGSKRALLRAATDAAAAGADLPAQPEQWRATLRAQLAETVGGRPTAAAYLAAVAGLFTRIAERTAPYWRMHRQAAATDPELAAEWAAILGERRRTLAEVAHDIPRRGLRAGLTADDITDTLWALASPEVYDLLTLDRGYTPAAFEAWLANTITGALCTNPPRTGQVPAPEPKTTARTRPPASSHQANPVR